MKDDLAGARLLNHLSLAPAARSAPRIRAIAGVGQEGDDLGPQVHLHPSVFEEGVRVSLLLQEIDVAPHRVAGQDLVRDIKHQDVSQVGKLLSTRIIAHVALLFHVLYTIL